MNSASLKTFLGGHKDAFWIYAAAFLMSCSGGVYMVAFPFVIKALGGNDAVIGICSSFGTGGYLLGCLISGAVVSRFNYKRVCQAGSFGVTVGCGILCFVVWLSRGGASFNPIPVVVCVVAFSGFMVAQFWAPVMGWLSINHEGKSLNSRFAFFNMSWSVGYVTGPYLGGFLTEMSHVLVLGVVMVLAGGAFIAICFSGKPGEHGTLFGFAEGQKFEFDINLNKFRMMSRVAVVAMFVCIGLVQTQVAVLFKQDLGLSESQFGGFMTVAWLVSYVVFFAGSMTHRWHYSLWPFLLTQVLTMLSLVLIINSRSMWWFYFAAILIGQGHSWLYMSHQFYAVSGSVNRSLPMALHEILLSVGRICGFLGGGFLAVYYGRKTAPYMFGLIFFGIGILIQLGIWFFVKPKGAGELSGKHG